LEQADLITRCPFGAGFKGNVDFSFIMAAPDQAQLLRYALVKLKKLLAMMISS
jgi:hypothetical protein